VQCGADFGEDRVPLITFRALCENVGLFGENIGLSGGKGRALRGEHRAL